MTSGKEIVLTTIGSFGDIHPYMGIAMELQARGHQPVIATSALYREKLEGAGLRFAPVRPDLPPPQVQDQGLVEKIMEPRSGVRFLLEDLLFPSLRDSYEDLLIAARDADLLVTHPITFAGPLVARKLRLPWISTVLAPMSFVSAYDTPVPPVWPWLVNLRVLGPGLMGMLLGFLKKKYSAEPVARLRRELGIADYGSPVFDGQHSPQLVLALFSSLFGPPQPDWPPQTHTTGFAFYDGRHELEMPAELTQFLDEGSAPIVFTLGSSAVWVAQNFFHESIEAARRVGRRAVLLIGDGRNLPRERLPADMCAVNYAPFESLLPRACAMVHHGGVGTTAQGLRTGVPTLIVPFAFDQPDNAARAERLGTSRTLYRKHYLASRVAKELDILVSKPQYAQKASAVGKHIKQENGAARACDLIEKTLNDNLHSEGVSQELTYASGD
ncbi:MAG TPA: glycosyltransferase [Pyrinomonadaceae bacterium]|nr:glycosyltransferase [Pyrinomonadaceae bacterium]